ncbi:hypothetical protein ACFL96_13680 [Thermoproteota archaeon]
MKHHKRGALLVLGGLLIGIGIGMLYDQVAVGTLIGLGVGFIAAFLLTMKK